MSTRRNYTKEFKEDCIRFAENHPEKSISKISEELGLEKSLIYRWRREQKEGAVSGKKIFPGNGNPRDEEVFRLKRENAELREAVEILKKAAAIFTRTNR